MKVVYTRRFQQSFDEAPEKIKRAFQKQVSYLHRNHRHPSLRVKKYDQVRDIWQARVNGGWRFYFTIEGDTYHLIDIMPHPK